MAQDDPGLRVLRRQRNGGKGAAVLDGARAAPRQGFTHALVMDSDGQHPADWIGASWRRPRRSRTAMVLGEPVFDASAPAMRVEGRRISNWWANLETLWAGIHDSLFGFRVYPIAPLLRGHARPALDAAVRLRCRGRSAAVLAGAAGDAI